MTQIKILYFAWVREQVGLAEEYVELPDNVTTVASLLDLLCNQSVTHALAFADRSKIRCALDQAMVSLITPLSNAKEAAFFPPVTGG